MNKLVQNPFKFGPPVEGDYYFPRPDLNRAVSTFLDSGIHVVLIGPRRFGKTSFILNVLREEEEKGKTCLLIDILNITSHKDFLQQITMALNKEKSWILKIKESFESLKNVRPKVTYELSPTGEPSSFSFTPDFSNDKDVKELIQEALLAFTKIGEKVIVAFDEFQAISEIDDGGWLEATLRAQMQQMKNVSFLFSGSRKHIIYDMLSNPGRPFYKSCQLIEVSVLPENFTDWIIERFSLVGISCEKEAINELRLLVQNTPNYIQMACFNLVAQGIGHVSSKAVHEILDLIAKQNTYAYQTILNSITPMQQRALRLAAKEGELIYSKELLEKYEITSAPALASAYNALRQKQLLDSEGKGKIVFDDPLFAIWLQNEFSN